MQRLEEFFDKAFPNMSKEIKEYVLPLVLANIIAMTIFDVFEEVALDDRGNLYLG